MAGVNPLPELAQSLARLGQYFAIPIDSVHPALQSRFEERARVPSQPEGRVDEQLAPVRKVAQHPRDENRCVFHRV